MTSSNNTIQVSDRCSGCGYCSLVCPSDAITSEAKAFINEDLCIKCKKCIYACPEEAIKSSEKDSQERKRSFFSEPKEKFDAIIIGSGLGGLLSGAFLSQKGNKVIVIEKLSFIGGRFTSIPKEGFQIPTGALNMIPYGRNGAFAEMLSKLDIKCEIETPDVFCSFYTDGRHIIVRKIRDFRRLLSFRELWDISKIFFMMKRSKQSEEPFSLWLRGKTKSQKIPNLVERFTNFAMSSSSEEISYTKMRQILKRVYQSKRYGILKQGCHSVVRELKKFIEKNNGIIKSKMVVKEILTRKGKVWGVKAQNREEGEEYILEGKIVVSDTGPIETFKLAKIPKNLYPERLKIRSAEGLAIYFSSKKSFINHTGIMFCLDTKRIAGIVQPSNVISDVAPPGKHLLITHQILQSSDLQEEIKLAKRELRAIFGKDFERYCQILSIGVFKGSWPVNRVLQGEDFDINTSVKGLYVVGDGCKPPDYIMAEGVAKSVEKLLFYVNRASV